MKLCKDCKYYEKRIILFRKERCNHPKNIDYCRVTGNRIYRSSPYFNRQHFGLCGESGNWWKSKYPDYPKWSLNGVDD